jgi:hypothetical protein
MRDKLFRKHQGSMSKLDMIVLGLVEILNGVLRVFCLGYISPNLTLPYIKYKLRKNI